MFVAATQIHRVLMSWIYRVPKLRLVSKTTNNLRNNDGKMRRTMDASVPPNSKYDILVSVFHPRPDQQKVHWNVRAAIDGMFVNVIASSNFSD